MHTRRHIASSILAIAALAAGALIPALAAGGMTPGTPVAATTPVSQATPTSQPATDQAPLSESADARAASLRQAFGVTPSRATTDAASHTSPDAASDAASDRPTHTVSAGDLTIDAPADWPVNHVAGAPGCVSFQHHAVYVGTPSESTCPAGLIGRTTTVQLFTGDDAPAVADIAAHAQAHTDAADTSTADTGAADTAPRVVLSDSGSELVVLAGGAVRAVVTTDPAAPAGALTIASSAAVGGESVTVSEVAQLAIGQAAADNAADNAADGAADAGTAPESGHANEPAVFTPSADAGPALPAAARASTRPSSYPASARPASYPQASPQAPMPTVVAQTFPDMAFDACTAPPVEAMKAWLNSSYRKVGVYVGGAARACSQKNLTKDWVAQVTAMGWELIPIYVGLQAPYGCCSAQISTDTAKAAKQGQQNAADAVAQMVKLGLGPGNPIYLDMEAWNTSRPKKMDDDEWDARKATVNEAVMAFTDAWTQGLHAVNYVSGFYTSASSLKVLVARAQSDPQFHVPDAIWFARWYRQYPTAAEKAAAKSDGTDPKTRAEKIAEGHVKANTKVQSRITGGQAPYITDQVIPDSLWPDHQRGWQYLGGHKVTHQVDEKDPNGKKYTINIDSSWFYGPTAPAGTDSLVIQQASLPDAAFGADYHVQLASTNTGTHPGITGDPANYVYAATDGSLPPGLTLSKNGTLTGQVTQVGVWTVTVSVTDPASSDFGARTYRIVSQFPDVAPDTNPFTADIAWLANNKITTGYEDGAFRPRVTVTRGQMAAYLYRYQHPAEPIAPDCTVQPFDDVPVDGTFCGAITWLAGTDITTGYPDGTFRPGKKISRGEIAAFLYRFQHDADSGDTDSACEPSFDDVTAQATFCTEIVWLAGTGITQGYADGRFHAIDTVSRQSMAAFLHRMADQFDYVGPSDIVSV